MKRKTGGFMFLAKRERERERERFLCNFLQVAILVVLNIICGGIVFSNSVYAASYVNVSSGGGNSGTVAEETVSPGIVNLGSIKPTSTGTMATGNDTLTIHTDCSAGYKVYVSGQNGKSTNLINSNAEDPTSPTTSELISSASNLPNSTSATSSPSSATVLNSNTWGINGNNTEAGSNLYYGLPSYSDATAYPLVTKADVPEESTVPIYYGVKVNTDITPGTYTGDVLYTVIMDTSCTTYNVSFNPNVTNASDVSGTMETQPILINTTDNLIKNNFIRSGYGFLGWSTSANGKTGTVTNGIGTPNDVEYSDESEVTDLINAGQTITLYAIWAKVDGNMQSWNGCSTLSTNQIVYLTDTRDNKTYGVKKTPDGKCWMLQNLTTNGIALTPSNTNITDGRTYYLPKKNTRYPIADPFNASNTTINSDILNATDSVNISSNYANQVQVGYRAQGTTDNSAGNPVPETTAYYNFYTATLGFSYYNDDKSSGSSTQDICPKGWHMPWTSDSGSTYNGNAEFYTLGLAYNSDSSVWTSYIAPGSTSASEPRSSNAIVRQNMLAGELDSLNPFENNGSVSFSYGGYYSSQSLVNVGTVSTYTSSSISDVGYRYSLFINAHAIYPQHPGHKGSGYAVRCVVDNYTISFDANGGTGTMENQVVFGNNSSTQTIKSNTFTKTGYHLLGWSTDSSATSATYTNGQTLTSAIADNGRTIKLYAVWAPNTYTINYAAGSTGGSCSVSGTAATYNQNVTLSSSKCTKSGSDQKGWSTSSSGNSKTYDLGQTLTTPNFTSANGGTYTLYPYFEVTNITYTLSFNANVLCPTNLPSTQTWTGAATSHTFTIPSTAPTCYTPATFSNYTYNGSTYNKGATITLSSSSPSATLTANYTKSCTPSTSTGCKLADNKTWILGNSGNKTTFNDICTNQTSTKNHDATCSSCPSGYSFPTITAFDSLIQAYGGTSYSSYYRSGYDESTGALYKVLGLSSDYHSYWSSTEYSNGRAYSLNVYSSDSSSAGSSNKTGSKYVLCYK